MTPDELRAWADSQPEGELTDDDIAAMWHWLMRHGPSSSWTNPALLALRRVLIDLIRGRISRQREAE